MSDINTVMAEIKSLQKAANDSTKNELDLIGIQQREMADRLVHLEQKGIVIPAAYTEPTNLVQNFFSSAAFKAYQTGAPSTGRVELKGGIKRLIKALTSDGGSNNYGVQAQRADGLFNDPRLSLSLFDALPSVPVNSNAYEYVQLSGFTHAATYQATEGAAKAEQAIDTATASSPIKTIATFTRASRQVLSDVAQLQNQLSSLLVYGCLKKLEAEIVAGTGTGGALTGLVTAGTALTTTGTAANRISSGAMQMVASGWNPNLLLVNPTDWHNMRSATATGGEYIAGTWSQPSGPNVWGLPVIATPSLVANTALVIDTSQIAVLDRESPQVMLSNSDDANFTTNLVTVLAELRAGLAIYATGAVGKVTLS